MQYRTLGKTGIAVSTIALGTMDFGSRAVEEDAHAIIDAYVDAGGNLLCRQAPDHSGSDLRRAQSDRHRRR